LLEDAHKTTAICYYACATVIVILQIQDFSQIVVWGLKLENVILSEFRANGRSLVLS